MSQQKTLGFGVLGYNSYNTIHSKFTVWLQEEKEQEKEEFSATIQMLQAQMANFQVRIRTYVIWPRSVWS
jgi:hypothetical protein